VSETPPFTLRPVRAEQDHEFLARLYASTRTEELAQVPWNEEQKAAFLRQQFEAQTIHYTRHFPKAELSLVECEGEPIGRLYIDRRETEIRLVDIALLPGWRGRGLGGALLARVLAEGAEKGLPVTIHVEQFNPALRFYQRLGFERIEDQGPYFLMEWKPPGYGVIEP